MVSFVCVRPSGQEGAGQNKATRYFWKDGMVRTEAKK